ncbi:unnamed protein product [Rhizoctonia solani]|uniref:Uncharacterized protein n=1 Tax=Rhizoctonia solani TaxID=456999 RepID=A0A8H2Y199_9AGAM|nr:unnamed protein product [Rhizoctonia solani]
MNSPVLTRPYTPDRGSQSKDQLYIWCDRVRMGHIQFVTSSSRDARGQQQYEAVPIFPQVIDLGMHYTGLGWSQQEAHQVSLSRIPWNEFPLNPNSVHYSFEQRRDGSVVAKPCLVRYGEYVHLTSIVGWGASRAKAEEMAAELLLRTGYCFFN